MKLNSQEINTVKTVWGEESNKVLELLSKKKGRCNFFNEDGTLAKTKDEVYSILTKEPKEPKKTNIYKGYWHSDFLVKFCNTSEDRKLEVLELFINNLEEVESLDEVIKCAEEAKEAVKEEEIKKIEKEIEDYKEMIKEYEERLNALRGVVKLTASKPLDLKEDAAKVIEASKNSSQI